MDPLIAAVPALVGIAAGILVVRLYPIPLAAVAWLAARGRGLVPMLAARRAREGGAASAVLLVLLATATVGAFAATALDHLDRGAEVAAWQEVGASWRIQQPNGALPIAMDPAALPDVEVASSVFQGIVPVDLTGPQSIVVIPEAANLEAVLAGTPIEPAFPAGFATPASGPIPAIVSRSPRRQPARGGGGRHVHDEHRGLQPHLQAWRRSATRSRACRSTATSSSSLARRSSARRRPPASSRSTRCSARRRPPGRRSARPSSAQAPTVEVSGPGGDARTSSGRSR